VSAPRLLVIGGGAIGGITAAKLTAAGRDVTVLDANAEHVARLRDPGLVYVEGGVEVQVPLRAVSSLAELDGAFELALVAVKSPVHRVALEPLAGSGRVAAFVSLGNGLIQDALAALVGPERLLACLVEWAGSNVGPGRLVRDTVGAMVVGELDGVVRDRTRLLAACLDAVGDVRISHNIRGMIWSKLLVNTAFTGLSAVSGLRYGGVALDRFGRAAALGIWAEGVAVGEAEGLALEPVLGVEPRELLDPARASAAVDRMMLVAGNSRPSMLQDLEAGRVTEVDVVNGGVAARGRLHGLATPLNDAVVSLVHAMERGERVPDPACLAEVAPLSEANGELRI
jgi:2-dehydropantoate 2-reductase